MKKTAVLLKLKNVSKFYYNKGIISSGFSRLSLELNSGEFVVITGESGSGKSTLLNVIAGLDSYEEGEMYINGNETSHYMEKDFEEYRKKYIGMIFQTFNLVNSYTVYQNIELSLLLNGYKKKDIHNKIIELIKKVDLYSFRNTKVSKLSGGQKQRVAIARALAKDTPIIIADEPTGNLDVKSAKSVLKTLKEVAKDKLVVVVTHNYEQVEEYATRKIEMHDGKIREDVELKKYNETNVVLADYNEITFFNKLRIGIRNTFNIFTKFWLLFIVFFFVILAFLTTYSSFRKAGTEENALGYSYFFNNIDSKRIVVKKNNNLSFSSEELDSIKQMEHVSMIEENDLFLDTSLSLESSEYYLYANAKSINGLNHVDEGRLPQNEYEIVYETYKDDYVTYNLEDFFNTEFSIFNDYGVKIQTNQKLKVVGLVFHDNYLDNAKIYCSNQLIKIITKSSNANYSKNIISINNSKVEYYTIGILDSLNKGECILPDSFSEYCKNGICQDKDINLSVENIYFNDNIDLKVKNVFTEKNIKKVVGDADYYSLMNTIFISHEDYDKLFNKGTFQISVFANDISNVDKVVTSLRENNYYVLAIKDSLQNELSKIIEIVNILKVITTVILFVGLFFIAYFVIKLIFKSKNIYFSTVRILGASKEVVSSLIRIELLSVFNITYIITIVLALLTKYEVITLSFFKDTVNFLNIKDYVMIYGILLLMSLLLANRYSRKMFKSTAMVAYRDED